MYELNAKIRNMTPYAPIEGEYPVRLDANESSHSIPDWLLEKVQTEIGKIAFHRYPDPYAAEVNKAFADLYQLSPDHITAGNGSDELISVIASSFLEKGDVVLTILPDFSMYAFYAELDEQKVVALEKGPDLNITPEEILAAAKECGAKAIFFSNPCNPTGQGMNREQVRTLIRGTDALVVLDEAYMDFWDQALVREAAEYDNVICLKTCSKAIGLAALRLGFAVANPTITKALRAAKSPYNVNTITQTAGAVILREQDYLHRCAADLTAQREALFRMLEQLNEEFGSPMKLYPSCANFVFLKVEQASAIHRKLLDKGIAIRCMGSFLRISAPTSQELELLTKALRDIFTEGAK